MPGQDPGRAADAGKEKGEAMNSSEWERRDTPKPHWRESWCEDIQTIRRLNMPRQGPVTHIVECGALSFGYRSLEEAIRAQYRLGEGAIIRQIEL